MNTAFNNLSKTIIIFLIIILCAHFWAIANSGYYTIWWLDIVLHSLGGFLMGLFFTWLIIRSQNLSIDRWNGLAFLMGISSFGVFMGVQWEFFEFVFDALILKHTTMLPAQISIQDTMSDLLFDWIGALATGVLFFTTRIWKNRKNLQ